MSEMSDYDKEHALYPVFAVGTPTAFSIREYMQDRKAGLALAVNDMVRIGLFIYELKLQDARFEVTYPNGEQSYITDDEVFDDSTRVKRIKVDMHPELQVAIDSVADDIGVSRDKAFEILIDEAWELRSKHKKGAKIAYTDADGRVHDLVLLKE